MKQRLFAAVFFAAGVLPAAEWTGAISESGCGMKHASGGAEKCVQACVKKGAAPVFVVDGKVVRIANGEKVMDYLGQKVKINGRMESGAVTVDSIKKAE
jgi:hypothetical protein